jgi:hypothetical protein
MHKRQPGLWPNTYTWLTLAFLFFCGLNTWFFILGLQKDIFDSMREIWAHAASIGVGAIATITFAYMDHRYFCEHYKK